jgi:hypothetical protein
MTQIEKRKVEKMSKAGAIKSGYGVPALAGYAHKVAAIPNLTLALLRNLGRLKPGLHTFRTL